MAHINAGASVARLAAERRALDQSTRTADAASRLTFQSSLSRYLALGTIQAPIRLHASGK